MSEQHKISLSIPNQRLVVAPGQRLKIPITLGNTGSQIRDCKLKLEGVPQAWIFTSSQDFQVAPGDRLTVEVILHHRGISNLRSSFIALRSSLLLKKR